MLFLTITINNFDIIGNLNLKVEVELAIYASCVVSLLMVVGAYCVVTLFAQLMHDLSAIAEFLVLKYCWYLNIVCLVLQAAKWSYQL